jgi:hypothetical protein
MTHAQTPKPSAIAPWARGLSQLREPLPGLIFAMLVALWLAGTFWVGAAPDGRERAHPAGFEPPATESALNEVLNRRQWILNWVDLPSAFTPGQISRVRVKVSNASDAQDLSTASDQDRFAWIDLTLVDAMGREVHRRAAMEAGRNVAGFSFVLPADVVGPIAVRADLNDRPSAEHLLDSVLAPKPQPFQVTHLASVADRVPLSTVRPAAVDQMRRLLLLLALGRRADRR